MLLKPSRVFVYGLLAFSLIGPHGPAYTTGQTGTPPQQSCVVVVDNCTVTVDPKSCKIDPKDPKAPLVYPQDSIKWASNTKYSISFSILHTPFSANPQIGTPQPVARDFWCNTFGSKSTDACYYKYDLMQGTSTTPCNDPGVRVVPPTVISFYYLLLALGALLVPALYAILTIRARKRASV
jgi:hypothetical protein